MNRNDLRKLFDEAKDARAKQEREYNAGAREEIYKIVGDQFEGLNPTGLIEPSITNGFLWVLKCEGFTLGFDYEEERKFYVFRQCPDCGELVPANCPVFDPATLAFRLFTKNYKVWESYPGHKAACVTQAPAADPVRAFVEYIEERMAAMIQYEFYQRERDQDY